MTQTAVTKRIRQLEDGLKVSLFLRSRRGMSLTSEGQILLRFNTVAHELEGRLQSELYGDNQKDVSLTIVGPTSVISTRVAENCTPIYTQFPFLNLNLQSDDHSDLLGLLRRGEVDFAIVPPSQVPHEMDSKLIKPDRYVLVGSSKWKGRKLQDLIAEERIIDFHESDSTTLNYLKKFSLNNYAKRTRLYVNENEALLKFLAAGVGYGTLTESVASPYLKSGKLILLNKGLDMEDPLALVWYPRALRPKYFDVLIKAIK
jgi:DNA-binding transcriptional LysR family regulator